MTTMMMSRSCYCILLAFLVACWSSLDDMLTTATIVETTATTTSGTSSSSRRTHVNQNKNHHHHRHVQQVTATDQQPYDIDNEEALSFDGDVSFIQQLAMQKAATMAAGGGADGNGEGEGEEANPYSVVYPSSCESPNNPGEGEDGNTDVGEDQQELQQHHLEVLTWFYSMEYKIPLDQQQQPEQQPDEAEVLVEQQEQNNSNMDSFTSLTTPSATATSLTQLLARVEQVLQLRLANLILVCANAEAEDAEIVSEVSTPIDLASEEQTCSPENPTDNLCTDYDGKMNLFLSNGEKKEEAIYWGRKNVQEIMQDPSFIADVGLGLVSITYLGPEPEPERPKSDDVRLGGPSSFTNNSTSTLGTASIALMAVGGAVIMVFVASVFFWNRNRYTTSMQHSIFVDTATATQAGGEASDGSGIDSGVSSSVSPVVSSILTLSDVGGVGDGIDDADHPTSPFSEMLPSAYRFNDNMSIMSGRDGLSAVTEAPEDQSTENSIVVSDSGYKIEAVGRGDADSSLSFEMPRSLYTGSSKESQTYAYSAGSTTMAGGTKEGGQEYVMSPEERLGARKRVDSVATEQAGNVSNNSSNKATCSPCDTVRSVRSVVSDEMSDMTCSIIAPAQAQAAALSSPASSMLQPKNLLAKNPTVFDEAVGVDTSAADDENMLFV